MRCDHSVIHVCDKKVLGLFPTDIDIGTYSLLHTYILKDITKEKLRTRASLSL